MLATTEARSPSDDHDDIDFADGGGIDRAPDDVNDVPAEVRRSFSRVHKYGLRAPVGESNDVVRVQLRAAHRYRCTLTEIERGRRAAQRELLKEHGDVAERTAAVTDLESREEEVVKQIKQHKAKGRTGKAPPELVASLKEVRSEKRALKKVVYEARKSAREDEEFNRRRDEIDEMAAGLKRNARAHTELFWGTYLLVEADMDAASKVPLYDGIEPQDPKFPRWTGEGTIGVQVQGGITFEELLSGTDRRARIQSRDLVPEIAEQILRGGAPKSDPGLRERGVNQRVYERFSQRSDDQAWLPETPRGERRRLARAYCLQIRVGSEGQDPIWANFPLILSRPIPKDALVQWVTVRMRKRGHVEVWTAQLTFKMDVSKLPRAHGKGVVGVDLGWRLIQNADHTALEGESESQVDLGSIRVAQCDADDGWQGEFVVPMSSVERLRKPEHLRSTRDKLFQPALAGLSFWIQTRSEREGSTIPEWFLVATKTLPQWRSQARLAALINRWRHNRWDGDQEAFAAAEAWRVKDKHLWMWEASQREKALNDRRERYRKFAAALASSYERVVLEDFDMRKIAASKPVEEAETNQAARSNRQLVAVSDLRSCIVQAFLARRGTVEYVDAQNTTRRCNACGHTEAFDAAAEIAHTCGGCGARWDQDKNAGKNIRERSEVYAGSEPGGGDGSTGTARKPRTIVKTLGSEIKESTWARRKRQKKDRGGGVSQTAS